MDQEHDVMSLNDKLLQEISIEELEERLELAEAPKTCGQYSQLPEQQL